MKLSQIFENEQGYIIKLLRSESQRYGSVNPLPRFYWISFCNDEGSVTTCDSPKDAFVFNNLEKARTKAKELQKYFNSDVEHTEPGVTWMVRVQPAKS